jgi:PD-(D/E)XK endonuclease
VATASARSTSIAGYCHELRACYLLPLEMSIGRAAVQLRLSATLNNQRAKINWAQDYELGATLSRLHGPIAQLGERQRGTLEAAGSSPAGSIPVPPVRSLFEQPDR